MCAFVFCCVCVCVVYERWLCCGRVLLALRDGRLCVDPSAVVDCCCCSCVFSSQCEPACVKGPIIGKVITRGSRGSKNRGDRPWNSFEQMTLVTNAHCVLAVSGRIALKNIER